MRLLTISVTAALMSLAVAACGAGDTPPPATQPQSPAAGVPGKPLSSSDISLLAGQFSSQVLTGGQTAPRQYRWVNDKVAIFLQLDNADPAKATTLRYIGISVKGVFCAEDQPGGAGGGFPHFHRLDAPEYAKGHGGPAGAPGYWLSWIAVDTFDQRDGRHVTPGVDYQFSPEST